MAGTQVDAFLKLVGPNGPLVGESTDDNFPELIEIQDWDLSVGSIGTPESRAGEGDDDDDEDDDAKKKKKAAKGPKGGGEKKEKKKKKAGKGGRPTLKITKDPDYSSPDLAQSYAQNLSPLRECFRAELYVRKSGARNFVFFTLILKEVFVVAYNLDLGGGKGADAGSIGEEKVELIFESCIMKYATQGVGGEAGTHTEIGWDFVKKERVSS